MAPTELCPGSLNVKYDPSRHEVQGTRSVCLYFSTICQLIITVYVLSNLIKHHEIDIKLKTCMFIYHLSLAVHLVYSCTVYAEPMFGINNVSDLSSNYSCYANVLYFLGPSIYYTVFPLFWNIRLKIVFENSTYQVSKFYYYLINGGIIVFSLLSYILLVWEVINVIRVAHENNNNNNNNAMFCLQSVKVLDFFPYLTKSIDEWTKIDTFYDCEIGEDHIGDQTINFWGYKLSYLQICIIMTFIGVPFVNIIISVQYIRKMFATFNNVTKHDHMMELSKTQANLSTQNSLSKSQSQSRSRSQSQSQSKSRLNSLNVKPIQSTSLPKLQYINTTLSSNGSHRSFSMYGPKAYTISTTSGHGNSNGNSKKQNDISNINGMFYNRSDKSNTTNANNSDIQLRSETTSPQMQSQSQGIQLVTSDNDVNTDITINSEDNTDTEIDPDRDLEEEESKHNQLRPFRNINLGQTTSNSSRSTLNTLNTLNMRAGDVNSDGRGIKINNCNVSKQDYNNTTMVLNNPNLMGISRILSMTNGSLDASASGMDGPSENVYMYDYHFNRERGNSRSNNQATLKMRDQTDSDHSLNSNINRDRRPSRSRSRTNSQNSRNSKYIISSMNDPMRINSGVRNVNESDNHSEKIDTHKEIKINESDANKVNDNQTRAEKTDLYWKFSKLHKLAKSSKTSSESVKSLPSTAKSLTRVTSGSSTANVEKRLSISRSRSRKSVSLAETLNKEIKIEQRKQIYRNGMIAVASVFSTLLCVFFYSQEPGNLTILLYFDGILNGMLMTSIFTFGTWIFDLLCIKLPYFGFCCCWFSYCSYCSCDCCNNGQKPKIAKKNENDTCSVCRICWTICKDTDTKVENDHGVKPTLEHVETQEKQKESSL